MSRLENQKMKLYFLGKILMENTDEAHGITMSQILNLLEKNDISADRKSIYRDIAALEEMGIYVEKEKVGKNFFYKVVEKQFEIAELKLLVDSVSASRFITEKKSRELIGKLESLVSKYEAKELQRSIVVAGRNKTQNESIYYNVDAIHLAMNENRQISFEYLQWNLDKELVPRKDKPYVVSPWSLLWDQENYYLLAFDEAEGIMKNYRVDKMRRISSLEEKRLGREAFEKLDMASYAEKVFGMFYGREETVTILAKNYLIGVILDRFGTDIPVRKEDDEWIRFRVTVAISGQFFGWLLSFGKDMKLISPEAVVTEYRDLLQDVLEA